MIHLNSQNKFVLIKTAFYLFHVHGPLAVFQPSTSHGLFCSCPPNRPGSFLPPGLHSSSPLCLELFFRVLTWPMPSAAQVSGEISPLRGLSCLLPVIGPPPDHLVSHHPIEMVLSCWSFYIFGVHRLSPPKL